MSKKRDMGPVQTVTGCIDVPQDGDLVQRHSFTCQGWVLARGEPRVEASIDGYPVGSTTLAFARPDVEAAVDCGTRIPFGFAMSCEPPDEIRDREFADVVVVAHDDDGTHEIGRRRIRLSAFDYRECGHGSVLSVTHPGVLRREDVYGSGPASPHADPHAVELIERWLRPHESILDVGCGIGAYGRVFVPKGYDWTGAEIRDDFIQAAVQAGLHVVRYDGKHLPFADASFDAVFCIEVLEHVDDYHAFVAELARVTRRIAFLSVPNYEALPVMARAYAVPWHMLEADHKNFFTRRGLARTVATAFRAVEVVEYGAIENFRTPDDVRIFNHLLAVARR